MGRDARLLAYLSGMQARAVVLPWGSVHAMKRVLVLGTDAAITEMLLAIAASLHQ